MPLLPATTTMNPPSVREEAFEALATAIGDYLSYLHGRRRTEALARLYRLQGYTAVTHTACGCSQGDQSDYLLAMRPEDAERAGVAADDGGRAFMRSVLVERDLWEFGWCYGYVVRLAGEGRDGVLDSCCGFLIDPSEGFDTLLATAREAIDERVKSATGETVSVAAA